MSYPRFKLLLQKPFESLNDYLFICVYVCVIQEKEVRKTDS